MPVLGHKLEVIPISSSLGIEHNDRAGIEIRTLARAGREVWRWIAAGHIKEPGLRVQSIGSPGGAAGDRRARRVLPCRHIEWRRALWSASWVAHGFWDQIEFPDNPAGLCIERIHASLHALVVSAGIADEDQAIPGDRSGRCRFAEFRVRDRRFPNALASFEVVSEYPPVLSAAIQQAIHVGSAAVDR